MSTADVLVDTSAAVPLVLASHEAHEATTDALDGRVLGLAGHSWFETYSVLTRLPSPARRGPADVARLLRENFPASVFLDAAATASLASRLAAMDVSGGAVYDALVGEAAVRAALPLATRDRRAESLYRQLGVAVELLETSGT